MNDDPRQRQLRQLGHDIKTHLAVVSMGLEALRGMRDDPEEFSEIYEEIRPDGVNPLKEMVDALIKMACAPPETP